MGDAFSDCYDCDMEPGYPDECSILTLCDKHAAAPELYEALKGLVADVNRFIDMVYDASDDSAWAGVCAGLGNETCRPALDKAQTALALADGEKELA